MLIICKSFLRLHLDLGDIIYGKTLSKSFLNRIESVQHKSALAIIGTIKGTSAEKLYQELGLEHLITSVGWDEFIMRDDCVYFTTRLFKTDFLNIFTALFQPLELQRDSHIFSSFSQDRVFSKLFFTKRHKRMEQTWSQ